MTMTALSALASQGPRNLDIKEKHSTKDQWNQNILPPPLRPRKGGRGCSPQATRPQDSESEHLDIWGPGPEPHLPKWDGSCNGPESPRVLALVPYSADEETWMRLDRKQNEGLCPPSTAPLFKIPQTTSNTNSCPKSQAERHRQIY